MKKRLFAGLLVLCMIFNAMPATAFAEETTIEPVVTEIICEMTEDCELVEGHLGECTGVIVYETQQKYIAEINGKKYETLQKAINEATTGATVEILADGVYVLPSFAKNLTLEAAEGVSASIDMSSAKELSGAEVIFNNLTFNYTNANYKGLQHVAKVEYNNCTINGQMFLYGAEETFNNCTFNQTSADTYNVWTYGAKRVAFNACTFKSAGKSVLVYNEGACATDLTVVNCKFEASSPVEGKAAIEIDTTLMPDGTKIVIDDKTTATGFANGSVSGNSLWNDKKNHTDLTVTVAGELVWPIMVAVVGETKFPTLQAAVNAVANGGKVSLLADATGAGVIINKNVEIDFDGHTYIVNSAIGSTGTETLAFQILAGSNATPYDVILKNGTIGVVEEPIKGSKELKAIVMNYSNLTLENMTVDGTGNKEMQFALSTNNGTLTLKENTNIKVNSGVLALDVDGSQDYYKDAKAVIDTTGVISGRVDIYGNEVNVTIKNGGFNGAINVNASLTKNEVTIEGGYFTKTPPSAYIVGGKAAVLENKVIDGVTFIYTVGEKRENKAELAVTPAKSRVESQVDISKIEDEVMQQKVEEFVGKITDSTTGPSFESVLPEAANIVTNMQEGEHATIVNQFNDKLKNVIQTPVQTEDLTIHVRPYLNVQIEDFKLPEDGAAPEVQLNMKMMYNIVASTEKEASGIRTTGNDANAVVLNDEPQVLDVKKGTEVEITVPLPEVFSSDEVIIVKHVKDDGTVYYYEATVNIYDGTITFINPNGFSSFAITLDTRRTTIEFELSDSLSEVAIYKATDVNTTMLPTAEKDGYIFEGWDFAGVEGIYSGLMTDELLTKLSTGVPIVATPVFVEAPAQSGGGSSANDSISTEEKTEKPVKPELVEVAMAAKPASTGDFANVLVYADMIAVSVAGLAASLFRRRRG